MRYGSGLKGFGRRRGGGAGSGGMCWRGDVSIGVRVESGELNMARGSIYV